MLKQSLPSLEEALSGTLYGKTGASPQKFDAKQVVDLEPNALIEISDQPFHPYPPEQLKELAEDIKANGQINPCTVRKKDGKYIVLAGRNRKRACELAGIKVSCILIECDDPTANLILVNSNLNQRQELLPSEKAFAYKLQKESYEAKGQRKTAAAVAEQNSENVKMIQRYIKLTKLTPELLDMVDDGRLPVMVGVELAYLLHADLKTVSSYLLNHPQLEVSVNQAGLIRKLSPVVSIIELDHLFFPCENEDELKEQKSEKKTASPVSVSIKIDDLKDLGCNFNFEESSKSEIREFILESLNDYFQQSD